MERRTDEELFCAFRERRDCDALSALFRRRAEELLRLAVFLAPRPTEADDLVQATFLSAIARAETYRSGFRVMSWLCGILTNHARMLRRAERRALPRPERTETANEPVLAALHGEVREALDAAIVALPEPYRSVMTLHLHDGLDSQEISRRLARPAATVRKQMERALDRLRAGLPMSLASAFVARIDLDALAERAGDAARFVDATPLPPAAPTPPPPLVSAPALTAAKAAAAAAAAALVLLLAWPTTRVEAQETAVAPLRDAAASDAAVLASPSRSATPSDPDGTRAAPPVRASLAVHALDFDDAPRRGLELLLVPHDGRPLAERLVRDLSAAAIADAAGLLLWPDLAPGRYDLVMNGSLPLRTIEVLGATTSRVRIPAPVPLEVEVVDPSGRPVEGAQIHVSETMGRNDAGFALGATRWDGTFRGESPLVRGRVFARHERYAQSLAARIEDGLGQRLQLLPAQRTVAVVVRDQAGNPLAGCFVALTPRSRSTDFLAPQFGRTDRLGEVRFQDPGAEEASVVVSRAGSAPACLPLAPDAERLEAVLAPGGAVRGVVRDRHGAPAQGVEVTAAPADGRSNEPSRNLLTRTATTDADGAFAFDHLPLGEICVRVHGLHATRWPLVPSGHVRAAATCRSAIGAVASVALTLADGPVREGVALTPGGAPLAEWQVVALPRASTAFLGLARARTTTTDAQGRFAFVGLDPDDDYAFGLFLPAAGVLELAAFPRAVLARQGTGPLRIVCDAGGIRTSRMRCQILRANGAPCANATVELRRIDFPCPTTRLVGADGSCRLDGLPAGRYQMVVADPGQGTRAHEFEVPEDGSDVDLGALILEPPASLTVQVLAPAASAAGLRVLAQNAVGDKYVSAKTDDRGYARLPPLPPGITHVLVHGPGIAPITLEVALGPGPRLLQCEASSGASLSASIRFDPAENPYLIQGPLQVEVRRDDGSLALRDYVGAAAAADRFEFATGLSDGSYRITALSIWGARSEFEVHVAGGRTTAPPQAELLLR